ncbi:MAG: T9SS type A sorting domain-containing protein [Flavobacteriales bacterium]|nr:T9SS type A sorting domain-containing protein [Flavobacteriales bacterium]
MCIGESTTLDITGQVAPGTTVAWFIDGVGIAAPMDATSILISAEGTYTVTVTDIFGCTYTESINVVVIDCNACGFIANINYSVSGCTVTFSSVIGVEYGAPSPTIIGYLWLFGDGNSSTEMNPSHLYTSPGSHTVTLFIYGITPNGDCCVVKVTKVVETTIGCMPVCYISASFSKTNIGGGNSNFTSTSFSNDFTSIIGYEWTINGTVVSNDASFDYPFTGGIVCLTVYGLTELGSCCTKEVCVNYQSGNYRKSSGSSEVGSRLEANPFEMHIYPNPANSNLNLELELGESNSATITIVDVTGKELYRTITNKTSLLLKTTEFSDGVYFLSVLTENGNLVAEKVLVQH